MKYKNVTLGIVEAVFNKLGGIEGVERFLRGELKVVEVNNYIIDCDANPFIPEGWEVVEHRKGGQFKWNPNRVVLYICKEQKGDGIGGHELRKKLEGKPVINANVLDYLLAHSELIPEAWKSKVIFFWGTIYCNSGGGLECRCLCWHSMYCWGDSWARWVYGDRGLGARWDGNSPAALCK